MSLPKELSLGLARGGSRAGTHISERLAGSLPHPAAPEALSYVPGRLQMRFYVQPQTCIGRIRGSAWPWSDFKHILFYNAVCLFLIIIFYYRSISKNGNDLDLFQSLQNSMHFSTWLKSFCELPTQMQCCEDGKGRRKRAPQNRCDLPMATQLSRARHEANKEV